MAGRGPRSNVSVDRFDDRRSVVSRSGPRDSRVYEDRYREDDIEYRRGPPREVRERDVRERDVLVREEVRERDRQRVPPQFLDEEYGRPPPGAGAMVLRARETEEFDFAPRQRRRSPSPEPEKKIGKEEIIIRREESEHRPPPRPRERSREREEIIIRKTEDDRDYRGGRREVSRDREEIIIRKTEDDPRDYRPPPREKSREREEIIIRRTDDDVVSRHGGREHEREKEEIIIRRDERDSDSYVPRSRYEDHAPRPISHERSRGRGGSEDDEIIIRREEREGRHGQKNETQEIIIRKSSRSRSPSPSSISTRREPEIIRAPPIHQEVITHHRHIDHGYEVALRPRPVSRPPSPPMPPPPQESEDRIEIHRSGERNGRAYDEDIVIDRNEGPRARSPMPPPGRDPRYDYPPGYDRDRGFGPERPYPGPPPGALAPYRPGYDRDVADEAAYYDDVARRRGYPGEAYRGATRDWSLVDVPPGTERVRMDGIGGGEQDITWGRYNGVRRSKFLPDGDGYSPAGNELAPRPLPGALAPGAGTIGPSYGPRPRDPKEGLWTEITKDLVVKEAIVEMGYDFEETDEFFYVMQYLRYEDIARLQGLSEDIRRDRHKRIKEMEWENRVEPPGRHRTPLPIEDSRERDRKHEHDRYDREVDERYIEREIVYRGGRPPPPPGWRPYR